jgi:PemK-like, MazF-like toxin of type II toxin-antitoxin system
MGKDRPLLVVGRDGTSLLGLMLSSQDHQGDRDWLALGSGAWDGEHRPSWVRLDRTIDVADDGIRREGAVLDRNRFSQVAAQLRNHHGLGGARDGGGIIVRWTGLLP